MIIAVAVVIGSFVIDDPTVCGAIRDNSNGNWGILFSYLPIPAIQRCSNTKIHDLKPELSIWRSEQSKYLEDMVNGFRQSLPNTLPELSEWELYRSEEYSQKVNTTMKSYASNFV